MVEKIIFLDVDGVLNYMSYRNANTANIDPSKVEMLVSKHRRKLSSLLAGVVQKHILPRYITYYGKF